MIGYLKGKIKFVSESFILIDCDGVGYRVVVGASGLEKKVGELYEFYIYTHVRENEIRLFGFERVEELELFEMLLEVSGVGPKVSLSLISQLGSKSVINAILTKESIALKVSGVGIKTADKIVLELADKLKKRGFKSQGKDSVFNPLVDKKFIEKLDHAKAALSSLGYSASDIKGVIEKTPFTRKSLTMSTEKLVKYLLSRI